MPFAERILRGIERMDELEIQKEFFFPICNQNEIERIFNVQNAKDYLLKIRAETIVDHMRLFRVYRNKALMNEKNWSLEKSFGNLHYEALIKNFAEDYQKKSKTITYGNTFSNDPNGCVFNTGYGPIITISDSLTFFFKFMNLALMDFDGRVPGYVCINALRIAIRVMWQKETLDFFMDPRGIVPEDIGRIIHSTIPYQMQFIAGHEFAHYLLGHLSESNTIEKPIFHAIFPNDQEYKPMNVYNKSQRQEFEADIHSIELPKYNPDEKKKILEAALVWFGSLDLYESAVNTINPLNPYGYHTHPSARDRYENLLSNIPIPSGFETENWKEFLKTIDHYKKILLEDLSKNIEAYEIYGSVYLDKPNSEWRGPELKDRIDYY